jgi:hypothetical protein
MDGAAAERLSVRKRELMSSRSPISFFWRFAILSLLLFVSCSEDGDPIATNRLKVESEIELYKSTVYVGEWVTFSLKYWNRGDDAIELTIPDTCRYACEVLTPDGDIILRRFSCSSEDRGLTLMPGVTYMISTGVSTMKSDMEDVIWPLDEDRLSPGDYQLRAGLLARSGFLGYRYTIPWAKASFTVAE